ncbi:serine hydrolase [Candidatus Roizmanbacteria bacterium]|nr:serine hydrolase [Candidatus Roizmanbacteria bacterium]
MKKDKHLLKLIQASRIIDLCYGYRQRVSGIPALAVGVIYKDQVILAKGYGQADPETCYRIASISKTFTAIAVLQLVETGKLNLDDKVSSHLAWFSSTIDSRIQEITIRQLLAHTSGLTRDGDTIHWIKEPFPDLNHIKKYISGLKLPFSPDERWKYSNLGYSIIGAVIEQVSGKPYEEYLQENICKPLGMTSTSSILSQHIETHLATGYGRKIMEKEREVFPNIETNAMAGATGLSSNVHDLLKFVAAQFTGNTKLLSDTSKKEMRRIQKYVKKDDIKQALSYRTCKVDSRTIYYHSGGFQGFRCNISFDIGRNIGIVTLANVLGFDPKNYAETAFNIINYFYINSPGEDQPNLQKYEGIYRDIWGDSAVAAIGDTLVTFSPNAFSPLSHAAILKPVGNNVFEIVGGDEEENAGELAYFDLDKDGKGRKVRWGATYAEIIK